MSESFQSKEKDPFRPVYSEKVEEIAFRAAEMREFQELIKTAPNKMEALRSIRQELAKHFSEIKDLPDPKPGPRQKSILGIASNDLVIAKMVMQLLEK